MLPLGHCSLSKSAALHPKCLHKSLALLPRAHGQCLPAKQVTTHNNMCTTTTQLHGHQALAMLGLIDMTCKFPNSVDKIFTSFKLPKSIFERPSVCLSFVESSSEKFVHFMVQNQYLELSKSCGECYFLANGEKLL